MASASKTRADIGARTLTTMTILAAVFLLGGAERSWAQSAPAPIVYAKALSTSASPNSALESRVEFASAERSAPVTFDKFQGRPAADSADPIDLRPGAVKTSFGAAAPAVTRPDRTEKPASASGLANAVPYAGPPYQVDGKWYVPTYEPNYDEVGIASWYGPTFHGKDSASGEVFDENAMTAAHPTLPIPSLVRVTNLENGKSVIVRLNDRGPFVDDRIIDLSKKAGAVLGVQARGTAKVRVQYVGPAPAAPNALPSQPAPIEVAVREVPAARPAIATQPVSEPVSAFVNHPMPPVVAVRPAPGPVQHGYFLQAGSFADLGNAHSLRDKLKDIGQVSVAAADVNGTQYYRVMVGPWASRAEAERAQIQMTETGMKAFVVARLN
jgi:rare lipoprotein A